MYRAALIVFFASIAFAAPACSDVAESPDGDTGIDQDAGPTRDAGDGDAGLGDASTGDDGDTGSTDAGVTDSGAASDTGSADADGTDADRTDAGLDADPDDGGADAGPGGDVGTDAGADASDDPGEYDTTGWDMEQVTISDSASTGTPDSYFFDVASGSPLAASITGGGSGTWSVNVFGGMSNHLYCTGTSGCQVMLRPEDTVVVVTAITTDIGSYTLTVDYSGPGLR